MENLVVDPNQDGDFQNPYVSFLYEEGTGEIAGESFMEDSVSFYEEIMSWIKEFKSHNPEKAFALNLKLEYFNTSTSKMLFDMLVLLGDLYNENPELLSVNWYFDPEDDDMHDDIMDMAFDADIEINAHHLEEDE